MPSIVCDCMHITRRPHWGPDHRGLAVCQAWMCRKGGSRTHWPGSTLHPRQGKPVFPRVQEIGVLKKCLICQPKVFVGWVKSVGTDVPPEKCKWKFKVMSREDGGGSYIQGPSD